jgi:hypothetical protein
VTAPLEFAHPDPEPGDDVRHVVDSDGSLWKRTSKGWVAKGFGGEPTEWGPLLEASQYLIAVEDVSWEGDPA